MNLIQNKFDDIFEPLGMRNNMGGNLQGRNVDVYGNPLGQMGNMLGRNLDVFGNELGMGNRAGGRGGFTDVNMNEGTQYFDQASFFTFYLNTSFYLIMQFLHFSI
jgi:hypothetical protein